MSEERQTAWPTICSIARVTRLRQHVRGGAITKTEMETTYLISSLAHPAPEDILRLNRNHWQIEVMHRDKDVTLGEDRYTNRSGHAPRNIFTLTSAAITLLKRISKSPTKAIEMVQDHREKTISFIANDARIQFL